MEKNVILYVEDELSLIVYFLEVFKKYPQYNFHLITCTSVDDALKVLQNEVADLLLLDLNLDNENKGLVTLNKFKDYIYVMPIIILSAYIDEKLETEAFSMGVQGYLTKDQCYDDSGRRELISKIRNAIQRHKLVKELYFHNQTLKAQISVLANFSKDDVFNAALSKISNVADKLESRAQLLEK